MILRSLIRAAWGDGLRRVAGATSARGAGEADTERGPAAAPPTDKSWRTPPLHDIDEVCTLTHLGDASRPLRFADVNLDGAVLRYCVSSPESAWRVQTLFTKEPGTIDWIHSFRPGENFVDVGANVGMYSIYAAVIARARVFAFEPESQNYAELCRSIFFNKDVRDNVLAWCVAIGEQPVEMSRLLVGDLYTGRSFHDFGEPSRDYAAADRFAQGSVAFSLDHLVATGMIPTPDHVKIDVDGHEGKVVRGMRGLLERRAIRSVLIEVDPALPHTRGIIDWMLSHGWAVNPDQVRLSREGLRPPAPVMAELHAGTLTANVIFGRTPEDVAFATQALRRFTPSELEHMKLPA
jgi:FkbM family methyltransferase